MVLSVESLVEGAVVSDKNPSLGIRRLEVCLSINCSVTWDE